MLPIFLPVWQVRACTRALQVKARLFVAQAGKQGHKKIDIYKSASVACAHATGVGQTVCDAGHRTQRHEKGLKFIRV